jgi:hypothetical protein
MNKLVLIAALMAPLSVFAAKSYQVTGPVTEVTDNTIVVTKGKEKFEIAKDTTTKGAAEIKAGDKVTVYYTMAATEVEAKGGGKADKAEKKKK